MVLSPPKFVIILTLFSCKFKYQSFKQHSFFFTASCNTLEKLIPFSIAVALIHVVLSMFFSQPYQNTFWHILPEFFCIFHKNMTLIRLIIKPALADCSLLLRGRIFVCPFSPFFQNNTTYRCCPNVNPRRFHSPNSSASFLNSGRELIIVS